MNTMNAIGGSLGRTAPRRAALLVHALPPNDRQWVLGQLPETEKAHLQRLLDEIAALGIPSQPGLLADLLAAGPSSATTSSPTNGVANEVQSIAGAATAATIDELSSRLRALSPGTLAALLQSEPEPLRERVLPRLDSERRLAVQRRLPAPGPRPEPATASTPLSRPGTGGRLDAAIATSILRRAPGAAETLAKRAPSGLAASLLRAARRAAGAESATP